MMQSAIISILIAAGNPSTDQIDGKQGDTPQVASTEAAQDAGEKVILKNGDDIDVAKGDPGQRVCKNFPPPINTRIGRVQVCKTRAEWDEEKRDIRQGMDKMQTRHPGQNAG